MKVSECTDGRLLFTCPGCEMSHGVQVQPDQRPRWDWNGSMDKPTFSPSIRVAWYHGDQQFVCHSFVRDGDIEFLSDCTHALAGKTVPIPEWE